MPSCAYCGTWILFGGVTNGDRRFCNDQCKQQGFFGAIAERLPPEMIVDELSTMHQSACPKCSGQGPVDLHTSHRIWSILLLTSWKSVPEICCRTCAVKAKLGSGALSLVAGWWGFPWGIIMTPIQVGRNFFGLFTMPRTDQPSREFENIVRMKIAHQLYLEDQQSQQLGNQPAETL